MQGLHQDGRGLVSAIVLAGQLVVAGDAVAQGTPPAAAPTSLPEILGPQAYVHYDRGLAAYEVQRYDDAIAAFQEGYQVSRHPLFVFAVARAQRRAGRCAAAVVALERFLSTEPGAEWTARARGEIQGCKEWLARESAAVLAFERARSVHAAAAARRSSRQRWALVTAGAGTAVLLVGGLSYLASDLALGRAEEAVDDRTYRAELDRAGTWRTSAALGAAVGGATLVTAALLWATAPAAPAAPLRERFFLGTSSGGVVVTLGGRW